jgi:hypothetical protein
MSTKASVLIIACGALAREITRAIEMAGLVDVKVQCLPAEFHNYPDRITPAIERKILENLSTYSKIFVAYGDCGTGGQLDEMLSRYQVERLPGDHCYEFFAGNRTFEQLQETEPGTFYLTDFLVRHFDRVIVSGLGLDRHPQLRDAYFGNYRRLVYLSQERSEDLLAEARTAADSLGLAFDHVHTGYGDLAVAVNQLQGDCTDA